MASPKRPEYSEAGSFVYQGESKIAVRKVFSYVCSRRYDTIDVARIIQGTNTSLNEEIVKALLEAALRLIPPDNTPDGRIARQERHRQKSERAFEAEDAFAKNLMQKYCFQRENDLRKRASTEGTLLKATPDFMFTKPVRILAMDCHWIEYKNYFGFSKNPYVNSSERKQVKKYVELYGPGMVVYKLGFEQGHLNVECVRVFREKDLLAEFDLGGCHHNVS